MKARLSLSVMKLRSAVRYVASAKRTAPDETQRSHVLPTKRTSSKRKKRQKRERPVLETQRDLKELRAKGERISAILEEFYPELTLPLEHKDPFQLLIAVVLSAQVDSTGSRETGPRWGMQTTDRMVNQVTPALFKKAPDPESMAALKECIRRVGLAPTKAKHISQLSELILKVHHGQVPSTFEDLEALPGVGHKTASVVRIHAFGKTAFPVDTHIHRLARRWGLTPGKSVIQTEKDLKEIFPEEEWNELHLRIILFGREHCPARGHVMKLCPICSWAGNTKPQTPSPEPLVASIDRETEEAGP